MVAFDATESLVPFRDDRGAAAGAILFDAKRLRQAEQGWFDPAWWGGRASQVGSGGRGGAWFVDGDVQREGFGQAVLRAYLRGGFAATFSRDRHLWRGACRIRSFEEFRLLRELLRRDLPVPRPIAAIYRRDGHLWYRAAILLDRLVGVRALADRMGEDDAPWEAAGRLIARIHRAGLDHADLNAHNLLFDDAQKGWVIDVDRSRLAIPATGWREANLSRLHRSMTKLRGARPVEAIDADFARLRAAYDAAWRRGV